MCFCQRGKSEARPCYIKVKCCITREKITPFVPSFIAPQSLVSCIGPEESTPFFLPNSVATYKISHFKLFKNLLSIQNVCTNIVCKKQDCGGILKILKFNLYSEPLLKRPPPPPQKKKKVVLREGWFLVRELLTWKYEGKCFRKKKAIFFWAPESPLWT